jgi:POT family proton-dependent oligopeptide transporter
MNLQAAPVSALGEEVVPKRNFIVQFFTSHPTGLWFFFWGEFAERCSYYGMRAILLRYMAEQLGFGDAIASMGMSYFVAACYFLPLIGGYVADNFIGKYWTIVGFSIPYILGHVILGIESTPFLILALVLLAMGSGVIKPNISTLMGMTYDQQRPGQEKLRSDAFAIFYGAINIGAAISAFAVPAIRDHYKNKGYENSYQIAFLFPALLMLIAFLIFAAGKRFYAIEVISRTKKTPDERREQWIVLRRIIGLFIVVTFFWSIFDQAETTWTLFARDHLELHILGYAVAPDQVQGVNPVLILILLPPITLLWHFLANKGLKLRPTDKMLIGFILTMICMAVMSLAGFLTSGGDKVSILWEIGAYILITCAEVCISVVGLELAFAAAPPSLKSFVTACWLLGISLGSIINAQVTPIYSQPWVQPGWYFGTLTLLMVVVTGAFILVARRFNRGMAEWQAEQAAKANAVAPA